MNVLIDMGLDGYPRRMIVFMMDEDELCRYHDRVYIPP